MTEKLSNEVLEVLACPACKSNLSYNKNDLKLFCVKCKKEFKVENGIPNMLVD